MANNIFNKYTITPTTLTKYTALRGVSDYSQIGMYEQYEKNGETYLQEQIFRDAKVLEKKREEIKSEEIRAEEPIQVRKTEQADARKAMELSDAPDAGTPRKLFGLFENKKGKKTKEKERREEYQESMQQLISGYAVAEETEYEEGYGRTTFLMQKPEKKENYSELLLLKNLLI